MGYSCSAKASFVLDEIVNLISQNYEAKCSNSLPNGGFWERGRENSDGAITGTCYKPYPPKPDLVIKAGSFKIDQDGKVVRFPFVPKEIKKRAERIGLQKFKKTEPFVRVGCNW